MSIRFFKNINIGFCNFNSKSKRSLWSGLKMGTEVRTGTDRFILQYCKYYNVSMRDCSHSLGVSVGASGALPLRNRGGRLPSLSPPAETTLKLQLV